MESLQAKSTSRVQSAGHAVTRSSSVDPENRRPLLDHLEELRWRILRSLLWVGVAFFFAWGKAPALLSWITAPIGKVVYLSPTEPFLVHLKLAALLAVTMAFPIIAWEGWSFLRPAVFPYEKRLFFFFLPASVILFFFGGWFGWKFLLPTGLAFLLRFGSEGMTPMITIGNYLGFAGWLLFGSALIFEIPIAVGFLAWRKLISAGQLLAQWRLGVIVILIAAAVITPTPDVVTQMLLALPMMGLYLLSVLLAFLFAP